MTDLRRAADDYLALRRALGYKLVEAERILGGFVEYLDAREASTITIELALEWAILPSRASSWWWCQRLSVARGFARYLQAFDPDVQVPPVGIIYSPVPHANPYVFTDDELLVLLRSAATLNPPLRAATYNTLIGLLTVTGMRIGEAIALDDDDLDLEDGVVTVRHGKWGKSRELVVHPTTVQALTSYRRTRRRRCPRPSTNAFFVSTKGSRLHYSNVCRVFRALMTDMGLTAGTNGGRPPRIHDLRHRFAVVTLVDWYRRGVDVQRQLPVLSTYLGHVNPRDTYWYLSATPELLDLAAKHLENAWAFLT